jgi:outer membrane receptor protein involved in Fe transport
MLPDRSFTGFSGAAGIRVATWNGGSFVANYSHSYRAPALEELYNLGPHRGNLAFEIGNADLERELGNGVDFGIRHSSKRVRFEANGFYYNIKDFIFLAPTGDVEDGLTVAEYDQGTTRYVGTEARLDAALHPAVWLNLGLDYVNAELTSTNTPLPRIPPLRGRVGLERINKTASSRQRRQRRATPSSISRVRTCSRSSMPRISFRSTSSMRATRCTGTISRLSRSLPRKWGEG